MKSQNWPNLNFALLLLLLMLAVVAALKVHEDAPRIKPDGAVAQLDKQYYPVDKTIEASAVPKVTPPNLVHSASAPITLESLVKQLADYLRYLDQEIKRQWREMQEGLPADTPDLIKSIWLDHLTQASNLEDSADRLERFAPDQDSCRKAELFYKQAAAIRQKELGDDDPDALLDFVYAARIIATQERLDEAVELDEQTLATFRKSKHAGWQYVTSLEIYGDMLNRMKRGKQAATVYNEASAYLKQHQKRSAE